MQPGFGPWTVGPEKNAILILDQKLPSRVWLPPKLANPGRKPNVEVGVTIKPTADLMKVFGVIRNMSTDEKRVGVPGNHPISLLKQLAPCREAVPIKTPVGMP